MGKSDRERPETVVCVVLSISFCCVSPPCWVVIVFDAVCQLLIDTDVRLISSLVACFTFFFFVAIVNKKTLQLFEISTCGHLQKTVTTSQQPPDWVHDHPADSNTEPPVELTQTWPSPGRWRKKQQQQQQTKQQQQQHGTQWRFHPVSKKDRKKELGKKGKRETGASTVWGERGWVTDVLQELKLFMKAGFFFFSHLITMSIPTRLLLTHASLLSLSSSLPLSDCSSTSLPGEAGLYF